jgi:hypothetical protein
MVPVVVGCLRKQQQQLDTYDHSGGRELLADFHRVPADHPMYGNGDRHW